MGGGRDSLVRMLGKYSEGSRKGAMAKKEGITQRNQGKRAVKDSTIVDEAKY